MEIYDHDSPETITFKNHSIELDNWLIHLNYIDKEVSNLLRLEKKSGINFENNGKVLSELRVKREENALHLKTLKKYREGLPKAAECEDVDCDMFFVGEHEKYRKLYMFHLSNYRKVKEEFFKILLR